MVFGGSTTVMLELFMENLPAGLDANVFGITVSAVMFVIFSLGFPDKGNVEEAEHEMELSTITE
jgi:SSS family solute:Na+ symporter